MSENGL